MDRFFDFDWHSHHHDSFCHISCHGFGIDERISKISNGYRCLRNRSFGISHHNNRCHHGNADHFARNEKTSARIFQVNQIHIEFRTILKDCDSCHDSYFRHIRRLYCRRDFSGRAVGRL